MSSYNEAQVEKLRELIEQRDRMCNVDLIEFCENVHKVDLDEKKFPGFEFKMTKQTKSETPIRQEKSNSAKTPKNKEESLEASLKKGAFKNIKVIFL